MRKIILITIAISISIIIGLIIIISTKGIKTDNFNNLINQRINEIDPKIKLNLNDVNFKLRASDFKFAVKTFDPKISINEKKLEFELIKFDLDILDYLKKKNPVTKISIISKENNINQLTNFLNEYEYNLQRDIVLKQVKKGKVKISSDIILDKNNFNEFKYIINGYISDAEVDLLNQFKLENINFNFKIKENIINIEQLKLSLNKNLISSEKLNIKKVKEIYEVDGDLKTIKNKINLYEYNKITNFNLDILRDQIVNLSSDNNLSFKINKKLKISDLNIESLLSFDELYTKAKYQDLIYLKNGDIKINYKKNDLKINLDSNFLFTNENYNNDKFKNIFKFTYTKNKTTNSSVKINLSNKQNIINSKEFSKLLSLKNFNLPNQEIIFGSDNKITFDLDEQNKIRNLNIKSKIKTDNVLINYKSQRIKKYFSDFKNQIKLSKSIFNFDYNNNNNFELNVKSKYSINDVEDKILMNIKKENQNYIFSSKINLNSAEIQINELDYIKKINIKSNITVNGVYKENNEILFKEIKFQEDEKNLLIKNLELEKNDKIKKLDLFKFNLINKYGKKNNLELKKVNDNYYLTGTEFDGAKSVKNLLDNSSRSLLSNFKNLNTYIYVDINKYLIDESSYLSDVRGEIYIKNSKIYSSNIIANLNNKSKFLLNISTNTKNKKITNIEVDQPEPFIKNYKFIKGFKEGRLLYESSNYLGKTTSNLKINDFKVREVPLLAKLLTLASLQGIADLLTGEGIRFNEFEMDYETFGNTTTISEMYAIGPAISLLMEGYIVKDDLTSLKGTLVPATTVNKTISKIPMLGELLVGKKIGEGVFGVSFKIKGAPKKLKTSVNPIKTLTPRFITRTLEKISN